MATKPTEPRFRDYRDYTRARRPGEPITIERTVKARGHVVLGNASRPAYRVEDAA